MENVIVKLRNLDIDPKNIKGEYSEFDSHEWGKLAGTNSW